MVKVYLPNMSLTLVRRATASLPRNSYLFRCDPKYTKLEIKEYLEKVYGVSVAAVNTSNSLGVWALGPSLCCVHVYSVVVPPPVGTAWGDGRAISHFAIPFALSRVRRQEPAQRPTRVQA